MLKSIEIMCFNALLADADLCRLCRDVYLENSGGPRHRLAHTHTYIYIYNI